MVYAAIVAGGRGSRIKSDIPKQFIHIGDKPVIIHTIEKFIGIADFVYVACPKDKLDYSKKLAASYIKSNKLKIIPGGDTRMDSVLCLLSAIKTDKNPADGDIVLTHDAARPFVAENVITANIDAAKKYSACGTYRFAVDTVALSTDGKTVSSVPPRDTVLCAQTPQTFKFSVIKNLFVENSDTMETYTDLCSMAAASGVKVRIVEGNSENFKITTPLDLKLAAAILK